MNKLSMALGLFLALSASFCLAEIVEKKITIIGAPECKDWLWAEAEAKKLDSQFDYRQAYSAWAYGFYSGYNTASDHPDDLLYAVDSSVIDEWIAKYCGQHPKDDLYNAVVNLIQKVSTRKRLVNKKGK